MNRDLDGRPVSVIDYNQFRKLEDKKDRIVLKKDLYDRKKSNDERRVGGLEDELQEQLLLKEQLTNKLANMRKHLGKIKNQVDETDSSRIKEVKIAEQRKRQEVIKRRGIEVPTY